MTRKYKPRSFEEALEIIKRGPPKVKRGRPRNPELRIRLYSVGTGKKQLRFVFTRAVVEKLLYLRDGRIGHLTGRNSHLLTPPRVMIHGVSTQDIPVVLLLVEMPTFDPRGKKLIHEGKRSKNDRWTTSCPARLCGVIDGAPPTDLDLVWDEKKRGIWMVFPDALMIKNGALRKTREELLDEAAAEEQAA